uniref:Ovule protein n=1 Tax=Haemonchus placei TaxID=6290 RepID=A0A0N4X9S8_HAEPC
MNFIQMSTGEVLGTYLNSEIWMLLRFLFWCKHLRYDSNKWWEGNLKDIWVQFFEITFTKRNNWPEIQEVSNTHVYWSAWNEGDGRQCGGGLSPSLSTTFSTDVQGRQSATVDRKLNNRIT